MGKGKVKRFFQFFYALPSRYMADLPQDRNMIWPNTLMGATFGAASQSLALYFAYSFFKEASVTEGDLLSIGALSAIPITTNILSGIYEWKNPRPIDNEYSELEKQLEEQMRKD
jgi:hypothetical protein